ncbi:MAG: DNA-processing protein DprA [Sulfuricurvum sp.]
MSQYVPSRIKELESMKKYPDELYFKGSLDLLSRPKISIVGTRRPNPYTRALTLELSKNVISNKKRECTLISDNRGVSHG